MAKSTFPLRQVGVAMLAAAALMGIVTVSGCTEGGQPPPSEELQKPSGMKPDPSQQPPGGNIRANMDNGAPPAGGVMPIRGKGGKK